MPAKLLIIAVTVTAVIGQLLIRRVSLSIGRPDALSGLGHFIGSAAQSPWVYASITVQGMSYILWILLVAREKLGVATAGVGGGFYILLSLAAWGIYGETLSALQWSGIVLITLGVMCIGLGHV